MPSKFPSIGYILLADGQRLVLTYLDGRSETINFPNAGPGVFESFPQKLQPLYFFSRAGDGVAIGYGDAESPAIFYSATKKISEARIWQIVEAARAIAAL